MQSATHSHGKGVNLTPQQAEIMGSDLPDHVEVGDDT